MIATWLLTTVPSTAMPKAMPTLRAELATAGADEVAPERTADDGRNRCGQREEACCKRGVAAHVLQVERVEEDEARVGEERRAGDRDRARELAVAEEAEVEQRLVDVRLDDEERHEQQRGEHEQRHDPRRSEAEARRPHH